METTKKITKLPTGQDFEEIAHIVKKYYSSIIELDDNSKIVAKNISAKGGSLEADYISLNIELDEAPSSIGDIYWDEKDQVPTVILPNSRLQIGKEQYIDGLNKTSSTITNGSVVYVSGAQGNRMTVDLANASEYDNVQKTIGMATHDIAQNVNGNITTFGIVRDLDTSNYTEGECIYVDTVAGSFTTITPTFGTARIKAGIVVKSHVSQGEIFICVNEDKYMFGDIVNGNYSGFEDNGVYVAKGSAATWRDEYVGGVWFVPQGASAPDEVNVTIGGVVTKKYAFDGLTTAEKLGNTFEIPHDVAIEQVNSGTNSIEMHIHMAPSNATSTGTAKFFVDWCLIKSQGAVITGSQVSISKEITASQQYYNLVAGANLPVPTEGFGIGDLIEFTLTRNPADSGDTYPADVLFYKSALHVPMDTLGSRQRYVK